jgi:hypothetical protein
MPFHSAFSGSIGARERCEEIVEAAILLNDNDDVLNQTGAADFVLDAKAERRSDTHRYTHGTAGTRSGTEYGD